MKSGFLIELYWTFPSTLSKRFHGFDYVAEVNHLDYRHGIEVSYRWFPTNEKGGAFAMNKLAWAIDAITKAFEKNREAVAEMVNLLKKKVIQWGFWPYLVRDEDSKKVKALLNK